MTTLQDIKQMSPAYADIPDSELAFRVWDKNYKETLPMGLFADQIGLSNDQFKGMVEYSKSQGYRPTSRSYAEGYIPPLAPALTALRGPSLGLGENITAVTGAALEKLTGGEQPFGEYYQDYLQEQRGMMDQFAKEKPFTSFATELGAGLLTGGALRTAGKKAVSAAPQKMSGVLQNPYFQAAVGSGVGGGIYGFMTSEGNFKQRLADGGKLVLPSTFFGLGGQFLINMSKPVAKRLTSSWNAATRKPTIQSLHRVKNDAYSAADEAGIFFQPEDMQRLNRRAEAIAGFRDVVEEADPQTKAALSMLNNYRNQQVSLGQLDNIRKGLSERYKKSGYADQAILDMIYEIDNLIQTSGPANELMLAARAANNAFKKAELIDRAFDIATRSAAASGTGGNVQNRYRQAINNILNSNDIRFFTDKEQQLMRDFVEGDVIDNVTRTIGKLDPSSNGLMLALNLGAIMVNPLTTISAVTGAASRRISEGRTTKKAQDIFETIATGQTPVPSQTIGQTPVPYQTIMPPTVAPITMGTMEREK